jgi:membrane peptidoglycan carboxypeptidase
MNPIRMFNRLFELVFEAPLELLRWLVGWAEVIFTLRFWLRVLLVLLLSLGSVFLIAYIAPAIWTKFGASMFDAELYYFDQRSKGIGIYEAGGDYLGIFDPRMEPDFNSSGKAIKWEDFTAYPDHKSEHVEKAPPHFWSCLVYLEDRNLGKPVISLRSSPPFVQFGNLYGIDPQGLMRMPYKTISWLMGKSSGGGGSTIAMQLARSYYKTLPRRNESWLDKLKRKTSEWWLAPIIQTRLAHGDDFSRLSIWAANHLPLAQRVGGDLYGVGLTSRIIFGKPAWKMNMAEQFVLAAAVNRPIQVLPSRNPRINRRRLRNWRHITAVRAQKCVNALVRDEKQRKELTFALQTMSVAVPQAKLAPDKEAELKLAARSSSVIRNNPVRRANHFAPSARFAARAEMVDLYGHEWRKYVARVDLAINAAANLHLREKLARALAKLDVRYRQRLYNDFTLDILGSRRGKRTPDIIVVAADEKGRIVRYFESGPNAHYYGSSNARDRLTGRYEREREGRAIASIAKMLGAILIANDGQDSLNSKYLDKDAPRKGLETCRRKGGLRRLRRAEVVFACSMSEPLATRLYKLGQGVIRQLVERLGFNMPYARNKQEETPPSTAVAHGLITGSPQKVHQLAAIILAALTGRGLEPVALPSIVAHHSRTARRGKTAIARANSDIIPDLLISPAARPLLGQLLSAPLCYEYKGRRYGTLSSQGKWCARRNRNIILHFAKSGTQTSEDPDTTIDAWAAGGVQFRNGKSYSYVILVGSGAVSRPLGYRLHSSQLAAPLLGVLLADLEKLALEGEGSKGSKGSKGGESASAPLSQTLPSSVRHKP